MTASAIVERGWWGWKNGVKIYKYRWAQNSILNQLIDTCRDPPLLPRPPSWKGDNGGEGGMGDKIYRYRSTENYILNRLIYTCKELFL